MLIYVALGTRYGCVFLVRHSMHSLHNSIWAREVRALEVGSVLRLQLAHTKSWASVMPYQAQMRPSYSLRRRMHRRGHS